MSALRLWPDARELLLLRAALGDGQAALDDFDRWQRGVDWDGEIDGGSFRLLPLLHANLRRLGSTHPLMPRLGGVHRHSWCEAQLHLRRGAAACALLRDRDVPVMASKGIVLATQYYASPALRPMSDIDLVVPPGRVIEALDILGSAGWVEPPEVRRQWAGRRRDMLALTAGTQLYHGRDGEIDLHWRLLHECGRAAVADSFWAAGTAIGIGGVEVRAPSAAHLLLHVVVHGLRPNELSPLRWIADAAMILRREGDALDWDAVLDGARRLRVARRLDAGLVFLRGAMGLPVPARAVGHGRFDWVEGIEARAFAAALAAHPRQRRRELQALVARAVVGDARRHLPRLALGWTLRRLVPGAGAP